MKLVIDQDEVLAKWADRILEYWNEDHPDREPLTLESIKDYWRFNDYLGPEGEYFVRSCCRYPEFYRDLEPQKGAISGMLELHERGHDLVIATASPPMATVAWTGKTEWVRREMPWFPIKRLWNVHDKEWLNGDILFDDGPHNVLAWAKTDRLAVLLDRPWNRDVEHPLIYRVDGWDEFLEVVADEEHNRNDWRND